MAIPISYNVRNLIVRKTTTIMTGLGIAMTVAVLLPVLGLVSGLTQAFASTGDPLNVLVLRKGGNAELTSLFTPEQFQIVKSFPGIAEGLKWPTKASIEVVTIINMPTPDNPDGTNTTCAESRNAGKMRKVKISSGRWFPSGQREITIGQGLAKRYPAAQVGRTLHFGKGPWTVVGIMDGGDSSINSELLRTRPGCSGLQPTRNLQLGSVTGDGRSTAAALKKSLEADRRLNVTVLGEKEYYAAANGLCPPIKFLGYFICIIMAIGSAFAAMNTMYAAVARRGKEIGTLRILGFTKGSILLSFFLESLLLSLFGGVLACLLVLPLNRVTTAWATS